jgi:hypothetical protein
MRICLKLENIIEICRRKINKKPPKKPIIHIVWTLFIIPVSFDVRGEDF